MSSSIYIRKLLPNTYFPSYCRCYRASLRPLYCSRSSPVPSIQALAMKADVVPVSNNTGLLRTYKASSSFIQEGGSEGHWYRSSLRPLYRRAALQMVTVYTLTMKEDLVPVSNNRGLFRTYQAT